MAHLMSELSNEIYDSQTGVDLSESDGVCGTCPYTVFLGVLVALLPKIIPRLLPVFVGDEIPQEKFDDEIYAKEIEQLFLDRFQENLKMFESMIETWRDNPLRLNSLGLSPDHPLAKEDVVAGDPEDFQTDLLKGIRFLRYRVSRLGRENDNISQIADVVWNVVTTAYDAFKNYFSGGSS